MIKFDKQRRVNVRVKPGTALERVLEASACRTATDAMHEIAVRLEAATLNVRSKPNG